MVHEVFMRSSFCELEYKKKLWSSSRISIKSKYFLNASVTAVFSNTETEEKTPRGEKATEIIHGAASKAPTNVSFLGWVTWTRRKTRRWQKGSLININVWNFLVILPCSHKKRILFSCWVFITCDCVWL